MLLSELKKEENFIRQFDSRGCFFVGGFVRLRREGCGGNECKSRERRCVCVCACVHKLSSLYFLSSAELGEDSA